jgi:hypothetical protein
MAGQTQTMGTGDAWVFRLLVATALLQALIAGASLCGVVLFFAAAQSGLLHDVLGVAGALFAAMVRIAVHVLTLS